MRVREYKPTIVHRTRMMEAITKANKHQHGTYQYAALYFRVSMHEAGEGTHAGHFKCLEKLYELYAR